jgi:capsid assembly protease
MSANALLARFDNTEVLVADNQASIIEANLSHAYTLMESLTSKLYSQDSMAIKMRDDFWPEADSWLANYRPYRVVDGVLTIPVKGILLNDFPWQDGEWATGYTYITKALERGLADPDVKGIAFVIDSGGGEVAGNFDLVDRIFAARGVKPIRAFAAEFAYSAAYSIASSADKITVARTGGVGSIGVVTMRIDRSAQLEAAGIKVHLIHYGKNKVDNYDTVPLSDEAKARIQERVNELGEIFVNTVARNRGLDADAIRATEASTYTASQSTSNGLADDIGSLEDAVAAFAAELSNRRKGTNTMSGQTKTETVVDQAAVDSARAEGFAAGKAEGKAEGMKAGEASMRARIETIVNSDEGKKRGSMAIKMATGEKFVALDADTIISMLADMPAEKAAASEGTNAENNTGKNFSSQMDADGNADLGTPGDGESANQLTRAQRTLAMTKGALKVVK